jgi:hypothetical protein
MIAHPRNDVRLNFSNAEPLPAPLADIAALAGQHAELGAAIAAAGEEAASLRVVAELQERLAAFDTQVDAGESLKLKTPASLAKLRQIDPRVRAQNNIVNTQPARDWPQLRRTRKNVLPVFPMCSMSPADGPCCP